MEKQAVLEKLKEGLKKLLETENVDIHGDYDGSYCVVIRIPNHDIELIITFKEENEKLEIEVEHGCEVNPSDWFDYDEYDKEEWKEKLNKLI